MSLVRLLQRMIVLCLVGLVAMGIYSAGKASEHKVVAQQQGHTERVLALIIRRNPGAMYRDFAGFPEHLMAEATRLGIDYRLALAVIDHESEFKPSAIGSHGEIGLMQVLPGTAQEVVTKLGRMWEAPVWDKKRGVYISLGSLGDAKQNVTIGLTYLAMMRDELGPGPVMLRAYNRGPDRAREDRPDDRYAERVALKYFKTMTEMDR